MADSAVVDTPKDHLPDLEALQLLPVRSDLVGLGADSEAATVVGSEAASAAGIEVVLEVVEEEVLVIKVEVALAEEVGMAEGMVTAQHHPLMLLLVQAEAAAVLAALPQARQSVLMVLRARMVAVVGMVLHVAHLTTDPPIVAVAVVGEVGMAVIAAQEVSPAVIASRYVPAREAIGTAIATGVEDETTITAAGRDTMTAMATTIHAANGDTSRLRHIRFVGWVFSRFSASLVPFCQGKKQHLQSSTFFDDVWIFSVRLSLGSSSYFLTVTKFCHCRIAYPLASSTNSSKV